MMKKSDHYFNTVVKICFPYFMVPVNFIVFSFITNFNIPSNNNYFYLKTYRN